MTDLEILDAADKAAHNFFDELSRGQALLEDADTEALTAFAALFAGQLWWHIEPDQRTMFRYHFAVTLRALGLRPALPAEQPAP